MSVSVVRLFFLIVIATLTLAACSSGSHREGGSGPGFSLNQAYARATELQAAGKCRAAAALYFRVAMQGRGYENAQHRMGECLVRLSGKTELSTEFLQGLVWLRRAAEANWPEAQGALAVLYLEGPAEIRDPVQAAMWLTLYNSNIGQGRLGFRPLSTTTLEQLQAALSTESLTEGQRLAQSWRPIVWKPIATVPAGGRAERGRGRDESRQGGGRRRPDGRRRPQGN